MDAFFTFKNGLLATLVGDEKEQIETAHGKADCDEGWLGGMGYSLVIEAGQAVRVYRKDGVGVYKFCVEVALCDDEVAWVFLLGWNDYFALMNFIRGHLGVVFHEAGEIEKALSFSVS